MEKTHIKVSYDINVRTTYFYADDVEVYALHDEDLPEGHRYASEVQKVRDMLAEFEKMGMLRE